MSHPENTCLGCGTQTTNHAYCDRCLSFDDRPSCVIGGEQDELYELQRAEYLDSLPPLLGGSQ